MELEFGYSLGAKAAAARGPSYDPASLALFAVMTTPPTEARKAVIDTLIKTLKASGDWNELDVLWVTAAANSQAARINWKDPASFTLGLVNAPIFTADQGFKGDGASSRLTFSYDANTLPGAKFTVNLASLGGYIRLLPAAAGGIIVSHGASRIGTNGANSVILGRINSNANGNLNAFATGHYMWKRTGAAVRLGYKDGVPTLSDADPATGIGTVAGNGGLLAFGSSTFSDAQISIAYMGGNINPATMHASVLAYLQAIGAA